MITIEQAIELAKTFTKSQGDPLHGIYFAPSTPQELTDFYYFDFLLVDKDGQPAETMVGGAPGFSIDKHSGEATILGWGKYHELKI